LKGFTKDHKFIPMTDYKKVTRKSRDPEVKTQGIRMKRRNQFTSNEQKLLSKYLDDEWHRRFETFDVLEPRMDKEKSLKAGVYIDKLTGKPIGGFSTITRRSSSVRKARDTDSGEIPPEKIFDKNRLTKHDGRYFLIAEGYPDTLAVDEYEKVNDNLFKLKRTILFSQSGEETEELLRVTGGGKKFKALGGVFGLADEKKFLEGLDSSGALQESNFGS